MDFVLIIYAQVISLLIKTTTSQYDYQNVQNAYYQNPYQNSYQNTYQNNYPVEGFEQQPEYEDSQVYQRSRNQKDKPYGSSGGVLPPVEDYSNEGSEECKCSCNKCDNPEPCCANACISCNPAPPQQNFLLVPFPYPMVVPPKPMAISPPPPPQIQTTTTIPPLQRQQIETEATEPPVVTTSETTVETTTPTSETTVAQTLAPIVVQVLPTMVPVHNPAAKPETQRRKPSHIQATVRRTRPVWMPKYGLVPIPDRLAEKLMSKLREVKRFKAE